MEGKRARCAAMRAAKERRRLESREGEWRLVRVVELRVFAAPDGRHVELHAQSERGFWARCGSERAVRGAVARVLWRMRAEGEPGAPTAQGRGGPGKEEVRDG